MAQILRAHRHDHGSYLGARIAKARPKGKRLRAVPFERPEVKQAEDGMRQALHAAFQRLRQQVAAQVRKELDRARKAAGDDGEDDAADWALAGLVAERLDLEALSYVIDEVDSAMNLVSTTAAHLTLATIGVDDQKIVDQVDEAAASWAKDRAAELVGMRYDGDGNLVEAARAEMRIDESTRDMVRQTIYEGLRDAKRSEEIALDLEHGSEDAGYAFSEERAALISNTEIRRAHNSGSLSGIRGARAAGVKVLKEWITSGHDTVCDDCQDNADAGPIDPDDDFPSGDDAAPAHPSCNCDVVAFVEGAEAEDGSDGDEEDDDREKLAKDNAALADYYRNRQAETEGKLLATVERLEKLERDLASAHRSDATAEAGDRIRRLEDVLTEVRRDRAALLKSARAEAMAYAGLIEGNMSKLSAAVSELAAAQARPRREEMLVQRLPGGGHRVVVTETSE